MYVIELRVDAVLRKAGSYDIKPSFFSSVAWIVPSTIGISTSSPERLSRTVSDSSAMGRTLVAPPRLDIGKCGTCQRESTDSTKGAEMGFQSLKDVLKE